MNIRDYIKKNITILDGGTGTLLQDKGLMPGEMPERWNLSHADIICGIHKSYYDSGSNVVSTNTFGANILKFDRSELKKIICAAIDNVNRAKGESLSKKEKFVSFDIGPLGQLLRPFGTLSFEDAVSTFSETVKIACDYGGIDLFFIETMNDSLETKAALLAVKENSDLPVFVANAYGEDGKLMTGATPDVMVSLLEGMGADAIGANCSLGPKMLAPVIEKMLDIATVPVIIKPNAGLPKSIDGETVFDVLPDEFTDDIISLVKKGVRCVGGCCGTTPEYIARVSDSLKNAAPTFTSPRPFCAVSSYTHTVEFGNKPVIIGERINPTGKKKFKEALRSGDMNYALNEALEQGFSGAHILDVNVGLPEIDEVCVLKKCVEEIQAVCDLPLQIDTTNPTAMEAAMRIYNGKPLINSVNGKEESISSILPLAVKYGGVLIALTLDENGIPDTAEGRLAIAENIIKRCEEYGFSKENIIFDPLAMSVSADKNAAKVTLEAVRLINEKLGCKTSLGISNVSFGLPDRDNLNRTFLTQALSYGLNAAIMNPFSRSMTEAYFSYCALNGFDENFADYIDFSDNTCEKTQSPEKNEETLSLKYAVEKGLRDKAASLTENLLKTVSPMDIITNEIIPALDKIGKDFEEKRAFLPQLLMSAEAAQSAFEKVKLFSPSNDSVKCTVVLATVKGDIHDIGKNIVRLLLENYGFNVIDLGRDVPPEKILDATIKNNAPIVGLSALMTTTVPSMESTIKLLHEKVPSVKIVVGGAVLTADYAEKIGADKYSEDAMETVRYAEQIYKNL